MNKKSIWTDWLGGGVAMDRQPRKRDERSEDLGNLQGFIYLSGASHENFSGNYERENGGFKFLKPK